MLRRDAGVVEGDAITTGGEGCGSGQREGGYNMARVHGSQIK